LQNNSLFRGSVRFERGDPAKSASSAHGLRQPSRHVSVVEADKDEIRFHAPFTGKGHAMISQQELTGGWTQLKGKIKERWGQLTDNDLSQAEGNVEQLVGMIQRKTGTARRDIEDFMERAVSDGSNMANRVASKAQEYAQQASDAVSKGYQQASEAVSQRYEDVAERVHEGYEQAEEMIRARPAESLTVAFGAGIITGILVALMMRSSR
jgi:uncharacterized protein YjbJ (UPF0337 family)